jgi:glycerol dehydrogenase-like iron-containing ADH family enzyme
MNTWEDGSATRSGTNAQLLVVRIRRELPISLVRSGLPDVVANYTAVEFWLLRDRIRLELADILQDHSFYGAMVLLRYASVWSSVSRTN